MMRRRTFLLPRPAAELQKAGKPGRSTRHLLQSTARNTLAVVPAQDTLQPGLMSHCRAVGVLKQARDASSN